MTKKLLTVEEAYNARADQVMVETKGAITDVLTDDNEGVTHQRFIITTPSGQTVLILNNLERSQRLNLVLGKDVEVRGRYRWNKHGGLIHETHADNREGHQVGWVKLLKNSNLRV